LASDTDPMGENVSFQYDNCDCLIGLSDNGNGSGTGPGSRVTSYGRDALHRITSVTDPLSHVTSFGYDPVGNPLTMTDALSHVTSYGYDELNRLTSVTVSPSTGTNLVTTYGYGGKGDAALFPESAAAL
jgi:YD repeat-containing protein